MRLAGAFGLAFLASSVALVVACSSDPEPSPGAPDGGAEGGGGVEGGVNGAECASETSYVLCLACCQVPDSYFESQFAFDQCMCDGPCKAECESTACSAAEDAAAPTPACQACLEDLSKGQTCFEGAQTVCNQDPACKAFQECTRAADCDAKD